MIQRYFFTILLCVLYWKQSHGQCSGGINIFPYNEGFESSSGGWITGGSGNDWAWGTPAKPVINTAGGGNKSWVVGGLAPGPYTDGEASWLQSPCFDFSGLAYPYIQFKVFWEMEQRFDGASLQYSIDDGNSWTQVGAASDPVNCLNENWFNHSSITYLVALGSTRNGWSGNKQPTAGSCGGGNGSDGWVIAKHTMPYLANAPSVLFRFVFGAGTICNNYDGFAIDDIVITNALPNDADFTFTCAPGNSAGFTSSSALCPIGYAWDFGDPASGSANVSTLASPVHVFSAPGTYPVSLTVSGPGNASSTISKDITVLGLSTTVTRPADCISNGGGIATVSVTGASGPFSYSWNSTPVQTTATAVNLSPRTYTVTVSGNGICTAKADVVIPVDPSCIGIYFPSAFTPGNNGKNDRFGPLGSLSMITHYSLHIYNRWGERVFSSTDPYEKWDGSLKKMTGDAALFVWHAIYELPGRPREQKKGTVLLIK